MLIGQLLVNRTGLTSTGGRRLSIALLVTAAQGVRTSTAYRPAFVPLTSLRVSVLLVAPTMAWPLCRQRKVTGSGEPTMVSKVAMPQGRLVGPATARRITARSKSG